MPALIWQRDIADDVANARNTFSSWDSCMSEAYCKWPAIIGIVVGSLIVLSIIFCCARCLCCGAECCCACCSCFNRCCPSPRQRNQGYQQPSAQPYPQYQSHPPPMYGDGGFGYTGPQTARFDAPSNKHGTYNEDALPAMPSWDQAQSKRVEEEEDVELEKLNHNSAQQESLLARNNAGAVGGARYYNNDQSQNHGGQEDADLGTMQPGPYHDYGAHQQFVASPVASTRTSMYPPTYHTRPQSSVYDNGYAPSIPPSYHTAAPSVASPAQQSMPIGRRPVQGSWRDV